jgi:hypothetical protein
MLSLPMPKFLFAFLLAILLLGSFIGMSQSKALPSTGVFPAENLKGTDTLPSLDQFARTAKNGQRNAVVGIYVPGVMALPVGQQPKGNAGYVTREPNQVTQFGLAGQYGTVGLLAHNDLAGAKFPQIHVDKYAIIIYGDGHEDYYQIGDIQKYQALTPTSTFSDFVNMNGSDEHLSAGQLFTRIYGVGNRLVLQTCIDADGNASWGRMFIIGKPVIDPAFAVVQQTSFMLEFASFGMAYR